MRARNLCLVLLLGSVPAFAQSTAVDALIDAGIKLHDQGFYAKAIARYQQALDIDSLNFCAMSEMALSYFSLGSYDEAIAADKRVLSDCRDSTYLKLAYITYGSCLDNLDRYDEAVVLYTAGIGRFPATSLLHFNLGVAHYNHGHFPDARRCFQNTLRLNPGHVSANLSLALVMDTLGQRVPAILAYSRFLLLEPRGERAQRALSSLNSLLYAGVSRGDGQTINIIMEPGRADSSVAEDDFHIVDVARSLAAGLNTGDEKMSEVDKFTRAFNTICDFLKEQKRDNPGFFWDFYAPFFIEMRRRGHTETFSYMVFYFNRDDGYVNDWVRAHQEKITRVLDWSANYQWKK